MSEINDVGYPDDAFIATILEQATAKLSRRTGRGFTLNLEKGSHVLTAVRDDGYHAVWLVPPHRPLLRSPDAAALGLDDVASITPELLAKNALRYRVDQAVDGFERGNSADRQVSTLIEAQIKGWDEGGLFGRLERTKVLVKALASVATPALGEKRAGLISDLLKTAIDDAAEQIRQDGAFSDQVRAALI